MLSDYLLPLAPSDTGSGPPVNISHTCFADSFHHLEWIHDDDRFGGLAFPREIFAETVFGEREGVGHPVFAVVIGVGLVVLVLVLVVVVGVFGGIDVVIGVGGGGMLGFGACWN